MKYLKAETRNWIWNECDIFRRWTGVNGSTVEWVKKCRKKCQWDGECEVDDIEEVTYWCGIRSLGSFSWCQARVILDDTYTRSDWNFHTRIYHVEGKVIEDRWRRPAYVHIWWHLVVILVSEMHIFKQIKVKIKYVHPTIIYKAKRRDRGQRDRIQEENLHLDGTQSDRNEKGHSVELLIRLRHVTGWKLRHSLRVTRHFSFYCTRTHSIVLETPAYTDSHVRNPFNSLFTKIQLLDNKHRKHF